MIIRISLLVFVASVFFACNPGETGEVNSGPYGNPPAEGFNESASDEKAIAIADEVMEAMGGRQAWDNTQYINWTFFGRRTLLWDKMNQRVRIDIPDDSLVMSVNLADKTGKVWIKGEDVSELDTAKSYLNSANSMWINDSYWLVMPYKLKDSGVTLKYIGQDTMVGGKQADVLQLTFEEVGNTPDNKYLVFVDMEDRLVKQWSFYTKYDDPEARFTTPWADYKQEGTIMLSGNRGRGQLTNIKVLETVPETAFTELTAPEL